MLRANYRSADGGLALGSGLGKYAEVRLGWQYDSVLGIADDSFLESGGPLPSSDSDDAAFLFLSADYDNRMVSAFPEGGLAANLTLRFADTALGGSDSFSTGELRWNAAIPVTRSLTLGFAGYAATDFSGIIPGESALPYIRLFDLQSSGLFYGLAPLSDSAFGHHILGTGIELRQKLGHISRLLGGDIFGVANLSAAAVYEDSQLTAAPIPLRWNPSLGLGIRVTRNFGMLLTGGLVADSASFGSPYPSLGFQLGSFRDFPEDRR